MSEKIFDIDSRPYYGLDGQEQLKESIEEVIVEYMEESCFDSLDEVDFPIEVIEFRPMNPFNERFAQWILETVLENLDDEYGNPDLEYTSPTEAMKKAAWDFVGVLKEEYVVYRCEPTGKKHIVTREEAEKMNLPCGSGTTGDHQKAGSAQNGRSRHGFGD